MSLAGIFLKNKKERLIKFLVKGDCSQCRTILGKFCFVNNASALRSYSSPEKIGGKPHIRG